MFHSITWWIHHTILAYVSMICINNEDDTNQPIPLMRCIAMEKEISFWDLLYLWYYLPNNKWQNLYKMCNSAQKPFVMVTQIDIETLKRQYILN